MDLSYFTVQPGSATFDATKIRAWVEEQLTGRALNPCCGPTELSHSDEIVRNDLREETDDEVPIPIDADTHVDAASLGEIYPEDAFRSVVYDPPFSDNQTEHTYDLKQDALDREATADMIDTLLEDGGSLIYFGFTTCPEAFVGREYELQAVVHWNLLGGQYDWYSIVLEKVPGASFGTTTTTSGEPCLQGTTKTVPNTDIPESISNTGVTQTGNNGVPLTLDYRLYPSDADLEGAMNHYLCSLATNNVVEYSGDDGYLSCESSQYHKLKTSPQVREGAFCSLPEIHQRFEDGSFDHAILTPSSEGYQRTTDYYDATRNVVSAAKEELIPLLKPNGHLTQRGHTATCVSGDFDFQRERITIFASPSLGPDHVIVTDRKLTHRSTVPKFVSEGPASGDDLTDTTHIVDQTIGEFDVQAEHACPKCGSEYYHHPIWYTPCETCDVGPGNYCLHNGTGRPIPHKERIEAYQNRTQCCPDPDMIAEPVKEQYLDESDSQATNTQISLSGFTD